MSNRLDRKVAIVTGGASGIGLAVANGFAEQGARVCVADISQEKCNSAAAVIGRGAFGHALDVRDPGSIERLVADVVEREGGVDILVNSAGVFGMMALVDLTAEELDRIFSVNVRGVVFMMRAVARQMIAQERGGAIVNVASGAGRRPAPGAGVYSASKAAVINFTQSAALELIRHGIRVNAIAPGSVLTPMWTDQVEVVFSDVIAQTLGVRPASAMELQNAATPAGRMGSAQELVGAVVFLASSESSFVVGQTLNVDGGLNLN